MTAAITATAAAARMPAAIAVTWPGGAGATGGGPEAPPTRAPTALAAATEPVATLVTAAGTWAACSAVLRGERYTAAGRLPTMATPGAPPTSRIVSLMALPAPAWWAGSGVMMVWLAGAMSRPMPAPMI